MNVRGSRLRHRPQLLVVALLVYSVEVQAGMEEAAAIADRVLRAMSDGEDVASLQVDLYCDVWLVVEVLRVRGETEAAAAVAATAPRDAALLVRYAESTEPTETDRSAMHALREAERLRRANRPGEALEVMEAARPSEQTVVWAHLAFLRGLCLRDAARHEDSRDALVEAGKRAASIGWREIRESALRPIALGGVFGEPLSEVDVRQVQGALLEGELLCVYVVSGPEVLAVVIGRDTVRCVPIGSVETTKRTLEAWARIAPGMDLGDALDRSRRLLVERLDLVDGKGAVFTVWPAELGRAPFAALLGDRPTVFLKRAKQLWRLRESNARGRAGRGILEVTGPRESDPPRVGGEVLLDRTTSGLQQAVAGRRWAAVHFSCPFVSAPDESSGLRFLALGAYEPGFNEERVLLSSSGLNLMRPDADIVVFATDLRDETPIWVGSLLAARTERVLACQWEQDPWATAALVRSFYETWNRGDSPASAASALRQAQLAVASKGEYRHPYYWAGWQLWGLP